MKQSAIIAPSILSADFACLGDEVQAVLDAGAQRIHFDVMDNHFVPNLTIGPCVLQSLRQFGITADIDVHLMIAPVDRIIEDFAKAGATRISFHPNATDNIGDTLARIQSFGLETGLALNPDTPLDVALPYLPDCNVLLCMTVFPGFGGQAFMPSVLPKLAQARDAIDALNQPIRLAVDGGINLDTIAQAAKQGADTFIAGSAIFQHEDYQKIITDLLNQTR